MSLNDKKLDELLSRVDVPGDLKDRLRQIPKSGIEAHSSWVGDREHSEENLETVVVKESENGSSKFATWSWVMLIAASLFVGFFIWRFALQHSQPGSPRVVDKSNTPQGDRAEKDAWLRAAKQARETIREIELATQQVEQLQFETEWRQKQLVLQKLKRQAVTRSRTESENRISLAVAYSAKSALELGADQDSVLKEWHWVTENYPNSEAAVLSRDWISLVTNDSETKNRK